MSEESNITKISRVPFPPEWFVAVDCEETFLPAPELNEFIESTILNENHALFNIEHIHLQKARIGFLWTTVKNIKQMRRIAGTAEIPMFRGDAWGKARQEAQMVGWFGRLPNFVITFDAFYRMECEPIEFLATLEHELYHCAQARDIFGLPKFSKKNGLPVFAIKGHDVEEHTGVVRRYGIEAAGQDRVEFVQAALSEPIIGRAKVNQLCGTC